LIIVLNLNKTIVNFQSKSTAKNLLDTQIKYFVKSRNTYFYNNKSKENYRLF